MCINIFLIDADAEKVTVVAKDDSQRYLVIDGHKRIAALEQLGRDTVDATVWAMSEAEALLLDRSLRFSPQESALEQGWLLSEMEPKDFYVQQRKANKSHHAAIRALAFKWIRILFRCWKDSVPYDESRYASALKKRAKGKPVEIHLKNVAGFTKLDGFSC